MLDNKRVGEALMYLRKLRGMSSRYVGAQSEVSERHIDQIEDGGLGSVTVHGLSKIAYVLGIKLSQLFELVERPGDTLEADTRALFESPTIDWKAVAQELLGLAASGVQTDENDCYGCWIGGYNDNRPCAKTDEDGDLVKCEPRVLKWAIDRVAGRNNDEDEV